MQTHLLGEGAAFIAQAARGEGVRHSADESELGERERKRVYGNIWIKVEEAVEKYVLPVTATTTTLLVRLHVSPAFCLELLLLPNFTVRRLSCACSIFFLKKNRGKYSKFRRAADSVLMLFM
jgi:hypothetical protein